ncbi:hypothetical protein M433DRAFT_77299 [Acidomyces richmondensis BFW]|nr:MAG: hypothetical protein FE78DRAFT_150853 [Acidomyces sp. 'richmondensis']KYG40771.1 hypothetical protein M433DRAFT_77299 [Acidomyces richmondensis BFW]
MATSLAPPQPLTLAIVGGGIAGVCLTLGLLTHAPHIRAHIYESAPQFQEIGAGVAFGINAQRALTKLDPRAGEAYARISTSNVDGHVWKETYGDDGDGGGRRTKDDPRYPAGREVSEVFCPGGISSVHRARFLDAMVALLPTEVREGDVSFRHRLIAVREGSEADDHGVTLQFASGTTATADAVIGCDGIRSQVRKDLLGVDDPAAHAVFTGKYAYRGLIPMPLAVESLGPRLAQNGHHHLGYDGHVLTFPIDQGRTLNVVAFRTQLDGRGWPESAEWVLPSTSSSKADMEEDFRGWGPHVRAILGLMEKRDKWALFDHGHPARTYHRKGKICLIGDAAHASTPHQGSGAGMAIEDAYVLARLLGKVREAADLESAFAEFEAKRKERTQRLVRSSREQAALYDFQAEGVGDDVEKIAQILPCRWDWIWDYEVE